MQIYNHRMKVSIASCIYWLLASRSPWTMSAWYKCDNAMELLSMSLMFAYYLLLLFLNDKCIGCLHDITPLPSPSMWDNGTPHPIIFCYRHKNHYCLSQIEAAHLLSVHHITWSGHGCPQSLARCWKWSDGVRHSFRRLSRFRYRSHFAPEQACPDIHRKENQCTQQKFPTNNNPIIIWKSGKSILMN